MSATRPAQNIGIDLLRVFSTMMIVVGHALAISPRHTVDHLADATVFYAVRLFLQTEPSVKRPKLRDVGIALSFRI